ncbi:hypothetical protein [Amycolatopsis kentuckyensis]|uniref:hypothetical protein n=1 Tax=Amycolatopsis kentuckyensis TaxID=218823 RepID=UPI00356940E8
MADEGWRFVRGYRTTDESGTPTTLKIGLVDVRYPGQDVRVEPAIQVDGKTALIPLEEIGSEVPSTIRRVLEEWWKREGR